MKAPALRVLLGLTLICSSRLAVAQVKSSANFQSVWVTIWQGARTMRNHAGDSIERVSQQQDLIGTWELEGVQCQSTGRPAAQIYEGRSPLFRNQMVIDRDRIQVKLWTAHKTYLQTESYVINGSILHTHLLNVYPPLDDSDTASFDSDTSFSLAGNTLILVDSAHVSELCPNLDHDQMFYRRVK